MEQFWLQISASTFSLKSLFELTLLQLFIDNKKYYFCELFQLFNLEAVLETNCITKSYTKEVIKKLLQNVLKRKGGEKNANNADDRISTTSVD